MFLPPQRVQEVTTAGRGGTSAIGRSSIRSTTAATRAAKGLRVGDTVVEVAGLPADARSTERIVRYLLT